MMYLVNIFLSMAAGLAAVIAGYNYLPLSFIERFGPEMEPELGATITTINAADTIRDSRSTINNNFSALNTDKIEVSTTTVGNITTLSNLVSVGTITTGTWNATALTVTYGGTGSTTLASNRVLLGNGTGIMKNVVDGTSGQFLTFQGVGTAPTWTTSSIDEAGIYNWTGVHTFSISPIINATTTLTATTTVVSTSTLLIATTTTLKNSPFNIELEAGGKPAFTIGDTGTSTPVFEVRSGTTTFDGRYTAFNQAAVRATSSNSTAAGNAVAFDQEIFDTCDCHDNSTNNSRLTASVSGYYMVIANPTDERDTTGSGSRQIRKNGSEIVLQEFHSACNCATFSTRTMSLVIALNKDDYIELLTNSLSIAKAAMSMHLIGK